MNLTDREREITADSPVAAVTAFDVAFVDPGSHLDALAKRFVSENVGALLVRDHDNQVAVVTERDVVCALAEDRDAWVTDCMTREIISVPAETSVADAAETMIVAGVRHLVVDHRDGSVGFVSIRDLLPPLLDSLP